MTRHISILALPLLLSSCSSNTSLAKENTFYEVKPFIKIERSDGINKKEASMILSMYQRITLAGVTLYYSALENTPQNWISRKKGHWGYTVMKHPILIHKKTGSLDHGNVHYSLQQLVQSFKRK